MERTATPCSGLPGEGHKACALLSAFKQRASHGPTATQSGFYKGINRSPKCTSKGKQKCKGLPYWLKWNKTNKQKKPRTSQNSWHPKLLQGASQKNQLPSISENEIVQPKTNTHSIRWTRFGSKHNSRSFLVLLVITGIPWRYYGFLSRPVSLTIKQIIIFWLVEGLAFNLQKTQHLWNAMKLSTIKQGMPVHVEGLISNFTKHSKPMRWLSKTVNLLLLNLPYLVHVILAQDGKKYKMGLIA